MKYRKETGGAIPLIIEMTVKEAKKQIQEIMKYNYEEFVIALIQIEYNLNENDAIGIYNDYMLNDSLTKITQIDKAIE